MGYRWSEVQILSSRPVLNLRSASSCAFDISVRFGRTPAGTTGVTVIGAAGPCRSLFTLTPILSDQGRGERPFGLAEFPWLETSPSATGLCFDSPLPAPGRRWLVSPAGAGMTTTQGGLSSRPYTGFPRAPRIAGHTGVTAGIYSSTNRSCRLPPAHQGMKIGAAGWWKDSRAIGATLPLWIPAPYRGTGHASDRRNDEFGGGNHSFSYQSPIALRRPHWGDENGGAGGRHS